MECLGMLALHPFSDIPHEIWLPRAAGPARLPPKTRAPAQRPTCPQTTK